MTTNQFNNALNVLYRALEADLPPSKHRGLRQLLEDWRDRYFVEATNESIMSKEQLNRIEHSRDISNHIKHELSQQLSRQIYDRCVFTTVEDYDHLSTRYQVKLFALRNDPKVK